MIPGNDNSDHGFEGRLAVGGLCPVFFVSLWISLKLPVTPRQSLLHESVMKCNPRQAVSISRYSDVPLDESARKAHPFQGCKLIGLVEEARGQLLGQRGSSGEPRLDPPTDCKGL